MFRGLLYYITRSVLRSRVMYAFIISLVLGLSYLWFFAPMIAGFGPLSSPALVETQARNWISVFGSILIFFAIFSVSRRIPSMINPGTAGFFLSKPLSRDRLLGYSCLSSLIVNVAIIWVSLMLFSLVLFSQLPDGVRTSQLLLQIHLECLVFIIYVPILYLLGLLSRSGSYTFMGCFSIWLIAFILPGREGFLMFVDSQFISSIVDALYYILPKSSEITEFAPVGVSAIEVELSWMPIWSSALTSAGAYALAVMRFRRMEF